MNDRVAPIVPISSITTMRGGKVFALLRDELLDEAYRIRSLEDALDRLGQPPALDRRRTRRRVAQADPPNWIANERDKLKWLQTEFAHVDEFRAEPTDERATGGESGD
jgi:hypothetical protein